MSAGHATPDHEHEGAAHGSGRQASTTQEATGPGPSMPLRALALQRSAGNRAVTSLFAGRTVVQRDAVKQAEYAFRGDEFLIGKADEGDVDAIKAIGNYEVLPRDKRMRYVGSVLGQADLGWRDRSALLHLWKPEGDGVIAAARANADLWGKSVKANGDVAKIGPLANSADLFTIEVREVARGILASNDAEVIRQLGRLGADADGTMAPTLDNTKDQARLAAMQKAALQIAEAQDYQRFLLSVSVGYTEDHEVGPGYADESSKEGPLRRRAVPLSELVSGDKAQQADVHAPPIPTDEGAPSFQETLRAYNLAGSIVRGNLARWPALYAAVGGATGPRSDPSVMQKAAGDPEAARKQFVTALSETRSHIKDAGGKIEDPFLPLELTTLHKRLMAPGARTSAPWGDPVYRPVVEVAVARHNEEEAAMALGLGAVAALGFIVAEFATGGLATFLLATGTTASVLAAGTAIDKAVTATALDGSAISDDTRLIEEGKASDAVVEAALATVFAVFDVALAAKAIVGSAKGLVAAIADLAKVPEAERAAKIEQAVDELGAAGAIKASGKTADELLAMVPAASKAAEALQLARGRIEVATGMGGSLAVHRGAVAAEGLAKDWAELATVEARRGWLEGRLNVSMVEAGAPPINIVLDPDLARSSFAFHQNQYEVVISVKEFLNGRTTEQIEKLVSGAYHEGRHAEQWWLAARRLGHEGAGPTQITARIGLPDRIARMAKQQPLLDSAAQAAATDRWIASFGTEEGNALRNQIYTEMEKAGKQLEEQKSLERAAKDSGDQKEIDLLKSRREDAQLEWDAWYDQYRTLPEEADAHGVHEAIEAKLALWKELRQGELAGPRPARAAP